MNAWATPARPCSPWPGSTPISKTNASTSCRYVSVRRRRQASDDGVSILPHGSSALPHQVEHVHIVGVQRAPSCRMRSKSLAGPLVPPHAPLVPLSDAGAGSAPANVRAPKAAFAHRDHLAAQAAKLHRALKLREADAVLQESPGEREVGVSRPGSRLGRQRPPSPSSDWVIGPPRSDLAASP